MGLIQTRFYSWLESNTEKGSAIPLVNKQSKERGKGLPCYTCDVWKQQINELSDK